jgi:hypothetical protein
MIDATTLQALRDFPRQLQAHYRAIPRDYAHWAPPSWEGIPSEHFTAIEQVWHVFDIEVEGYRERFRRTLEEDAPLLPSIDSEAVAVERDYAARDVEQAFAGFASARANTVALLAGLDDAQLERPAVFEGYGPTTLRGLVHYLCSHDQQHLAGLQWLMGQIDAVRAHAGSMGV